MRGEGNYQKVIDYVNSFLPNNITQNIMTKAKAL